MYTTVTDLSLRKLIKYYPVTMHSIRNVAVILVLCTHGLSFMLHWRPAVHTYMHACFGTVVNPNEWNGSNIKNCMKTSGDRGYVHTKTVCHAMQVFDVLTKVKFHQEHHHHCKFLQLGKEVDSKLRSALKCTIFWCLHNFSDSIWHGVHISRFSCSPVWCCCSIHLELLIYGISQELKLSHQVARQGNSLENNANVIQEKKVQNVAYHKDQATIVEVVVHLLTYLHV